jgi:hypothetical protein
MPLEIGLWRIEDDTPRTIDASAIDAEARLESILEDNLTMLGLEDLLVLERQVATDSGARLDLLAIDSSGVLHVIELKRNRTPRDVVAQALDYGSWARRLGAEQIANIFEGGRYANERTLGEAFEEHFNIELPETINDSHRLIIVASELDPSTERIVEYLLEEYSVPMNVVFFRYFRDGDSEYLARSWFRDPALVETQARPPRSKRTQPDAWNGRDFYVTCGPETARAWEDAHRYSFVSAGGGPRWSDRIRELKPGHRVFAYLPQHGYVGVGEVIGDVLRARDFQVEEEGVRKPLTDPQVHLVQPAILNDLEDEVRCEYLAPVRWIKAVPREEAYREPGMFAIPIAACRLRHRSTLEKLYKHFTLGDLPVGSAEIAKVGQ